MSRPASRTYRVQVSRIDRLSPHFVRVTFWSEELADIGTAGPDQRIKLFFPLPGSRVSVLPPGDDWYAAWRMQPDGVRNPMRTYTIRRADRMARELVVDLVAHGDAGPASRWISRARVGDELLVVGPDATSDAPPVGFEWHPGTASTVLVAGDETAVPAISGIVESLAPDAVGAVFLEVPTALDVLDLRAPSGVELTWLPRDAHGAPGYGALLGDAVREWAGRWVAEHGSDAPAAEPDDALLNPGSEVLWEVPQEPDDAGLYAWLAGEAGAITGLRRHLVRELGIDRSRIAFMGYWKLGRAEN